MNDIAPMRETKVKALNLQMNKTEPADEILSALSLRLISERIDIG